jgi:hypothetical protein
MTMPSKSMVPTALLLSFLMLGGLLTGCTKKVETREVVPVDKYGLGERAESKPAFAPAAAPTPAPELMPAPKERMIHHNGFKKLRTPRPQQLLEDATRTVRAVGGYVERIDTAQGVFRVPVAKFEATFAKLLELGDVLDKSITTQDITDAFVDLDLRLKIAETTRQRLVELLAKAKTEKEKLKLLREIQRINEKIENLTAQRDTLLKLSQFSRVTVQVVARQQGMPKAQKEDISAFAWIHRLSPFRRDVALEGKVIKFQVPKEMVLLDGKKFWIAESADGAVFWASRHDQQPAGDTDFWLEALRLRLAPEFAAAETLQAGSFKILRFKDRSEKPYLYLVGIHVTKDNALELVEVYYPSQQQEERYGAAILTAIGKGAK